MEADLHAIGKKHKPMTAKERSDKVITKVHKEQVTNWEEVVEWMKKEKAKKVFRSDWWPLIPRGCYDWRNSNSNQGRDFERHSKIALIEADSVKQYRERLFETSLAACTLRSEFRDTMQGICVDQQVEFSDTTKSISTEGTWWYADMLFDMWTGDDSENPTTIDIEELHEIQERKEIMESHRSEYTRQIMKLQNHPAMTATPYTDELHPTIAKLLEQLNDVCTILHVVLHLPTGVAVNQGGCSEHSSTPQDARTGSNSQQEEEEGRSRS